MTKSLSNNYIKVKEFAEKAGVSSQAIYKQLNNKLVNYTIKDGRTTKVDIKALWEIYKMEEYNPDATDRTTSWSTKSTENEQVANITQEYIQTLKDQLLAKDEQIAQLQKQLDQEQQLRLLESQNHQLALQEHIEQQEKKEKEQEPKGHRWFFFKK